MENTVKTGHPKGLFLLFTVEMWERFSYYGMRAIFMLYLTKALLIDSKEAGGIYGTYTSLVYLTPLIGGFIADRYWGNRRSIIVGGVLMAIAQFLMYFSASLYQTPDTAIPVMYISLAFLIFGNGFFKPNISSMVGTLYPKGDSRIDSAYTIFYMGINAGAFIAPLVCGGFGESDDLGDFKYGFLAAGLGMVLSTVIMLMFQNKYVVTPEGEPIGLPPKHYKKELKEGEVDTDNAPLTKEEKDRIWAIFIITGFVIAFWAAFEQAGASLTLFADANTDRTIGSWTMKASWFQSVNPVFIIALAPLFTMLWGRLGARGKEPSSPMKMVWGLGILALGYVLIAFAVKGMGMEDKISMFFLIGMYFLHTCGELAISPVGLSVVNKLSPKRFVSMMMAVFFLSSVVGNFAAGLFSGFIPQPEVKEFIVDGSMQKDDAMMIAANLISTSGNPLEPAYLKGFEANEKEAGREMKKENLAPEKITSKGVFTLRGEVDGMKVEFASQDSLSVSNAGLASAYNGNKDVMIRELAVDGKHVGSVVFQNSTSSLFGFEIGTLYSFFVIFIFMSGATSLLLFVLHKRVEKLMHGIR